jgi:ABC-2 type transport system ATP-binding protein
VSRPLSLLTAALLTAVTAAAGWPASAHAATGHDQAFTTQAIEIETLVGPDNDIACTVQADLYTPEGVDAGNKAPAILTSNGFGGSKDDEGQTAGASAFAKAGYVAISYSGLGFGGSDCKIYLDDRDYDGQAGKQIVDVLAGSRAYRDEGGGDEKFIDYVATDGPADPRVGMIGGSYGGQNQFAIAAQDDRIDAIIPTITWNDLSYSLAPNNTDQAPGTVTYDTPGVAKKQWIDLFFGLGIVSGLENTTTTADPDPLAGCPNFRNEACPAAAQLNTLGYPDDSTLELARHASVGSYLEDIKVPTLLVQGQNDTLFNIQEAVATYRALKAQGTTVAMSWFSGGHSGDAVDGDLDLTGGVDASHQGRRWIDWMDRFVRGDSSASAGPEFEYFRDWEGGSVDDAYAAEDGYTGAPTSTLYLSGTDRLTQSRGSVTAGSAQFTASPAGTSYSETSGVGNSGPTDQPPPSDTPGTFASYTTAKLTRATDMVGSPRLNVRISAPAAAQTQAAGPGGKLVLFTKLYDVAPDGTQKLQHRLISPIRVKDVTKPVQIDLPGVAQRFPAGHKIRLVIAGGDSAYANNSTAQPVTVLTSRQRPGTLTLPLVSSTAGSCPKGTTGKQPFCEKPVATGTTGPGSEGSGGGGDEPSSSGSAGEGGGAEAGAGAGAGSGAQASNAFSGDRASSLPETGSPRGLLAALALGLALLIAGSLLVLGQRVRLQA